MEFPKTLKPLQQLGSLGDYTLKGNIGETYAFYETEIKMGFKQGYEIETVYIKDVTKQLVRVNKLSGNTWGKGKYLIIREDYFFTMEDAIGYLQEKTKVYKPKHKPEHIRALTEQQIKEYWGI